ncbi:hypothetical protein FD754_015860, partial [Muntiacus muntjak]
MRRLYLVTVYECKIASRGGGTICGRKIAGHCKLKCGSLEKTMFMCDRYKQCCVKGLFIAKPVMQPPIQNPNKP